MASIAAHRDIEFAAVPKQVDAPAVPASQLGKWTRKGLELVNRFALRAGRGSNPTYYVWKVLPQQGSNADRAWAAQRKRQVSGGTGRLRVVHLIAGCMVCTCTCTVWETYSIECADVFAIHGDVGEGSASWYWREGTATGIIDKIIVDAGKRPLGPAVRSLQHPHSASGRPDMPPKWAVVFGNRHIELAYTDIVNEVPTPTAALSSSPVMRTNSSLSSSQQATESNYAISQWCKRIFDEIMTEVSSAGADPKVGPEIKKTSGKICL